MTISQALHHAIAVLARSGSARVDAEVLLMHATHLSRTELITRDNVPLTREQQEDFESMLARRAAGEPIAYITGSREFWSMELDVTPDVLIPRPETELLVESALATVPASGLWRIADLGTGTGAIALALGRERPGCRITATDRSAAALAIARRNAARLQIDNVEFRLGDWFAPLEGEQYMLIVSNPPYIADNDPHLTIGDVQFEPRVALASGDDGLDAIRQIAAKALGHLEPGGHLMVEHGFDQGDAVADILRSNGISVDRCVADLAGHDRVTIGRRTA